MTEFVITPTHKKLLARLQISYEPSRWGVGHLSIESKRPYGNSDVLRDIAEIAGMRKLDLEKDEEYTDAEVKQMQLLHSEMATVLKMVIRDAAADYRKLTHAAVKGLKHIGSFTHKAGDDPHPLDCSLAGRVCQVFLVGMTSACAICRDAGEDPDYRERHCDACDIAVDNASDLDEVGLCNHCAINADH